jgi:T4 superinfection immunity protein/putative oligomerization/nucleic acid binding protein
LDLLYPDRVWASDDNTGAVFAFVIFGLLLFLVIFFLPTIVAFNRVHPNRGVILAVNAFLGGTGIVWVICLIWAMKAIHISEGAACSDGGESGLNIFANDEKKVRIVNQPNVAEGIAAMKSLDIATQLTRLKELFDSGAITRPEFDELKSQIISGTNSDR